MGYARVLLAGLLLLFCVGLNAQSGLQRLDEHILENLASGRTEGQTQMWRLISNAGSTVTTYLLNLAIKKLVKRPRPFITDVHLVPVYRPDEYSFPSGHTSSAFSAVTSLSRVYPKWYVIAPSFLWASAVGYSRMYLGVHYPTDVTSGAVLGVGTAFAMGFLRP